MARRRELFTSYVRATDGPLTVLAVLMIPLLLAPVLFELKPPVERIVLGLDWTIWAVFAVDYLARLYLSPARWKFVRTHVPDLLIVLVPFLRPLRALRVLRVLRVAAFAGRFFQGLRAVRTKRGLNYVLLVVIAVVVLSALAVTEFERGAEGSNISSFPDALWWAATTVTTVGYGDRFPVTAMGRGVGVFLMVAGIALFGVLTASIAAFFVESDRQVEEGSTVTLEDIAERLAAIEEKLDAGNTRPLY